MFYIAWDDIFFFVVFSQSFEQRGVFAYRAEENAVIH